MYMYEEGQFFHFITYKQKCFERKKLKKLEFNGLNYPCSAYIHTYIHTEYVLAEMPCVPAIFLFYGICCVDYNPVFAKKSLIAYRFR